MNTQMPIFGIYEKALKPQSFEGMFEQARECGYEAFEMSIDCTDERLQRLDWDNREIVRVWTAAQQTGIKLLTVCLSGNKRYSLGSSDAEMEKTGLEIVQKAIDLSGALGIRVIQVSGFDVFNSEPRTTQTRDRYIGNLEKCVRMAEKACVTLAIEPVEGNLLAIRDTMEVVRGIDSCWLQIYPDVANINSMGIDPIEELPYGKGHIVAVHMRDSVMDCYDATIPFGTGCLDFDGVFRKLDELEFSGPLVVEMWNTERDNYKEYIVQARQYMENCIMRVRSSNV